MTAGTALRVRPGGVPWRAIVAAELLKLRKRRGLFWSTLLLVVVPVVVAYLILVLHHAIDPEHAAPAGGITNLRGTHAFLAQVGMVAAIMIGVTAGGGDLSAGVFRELVVTGRSRIALFSVRLPGAILFLAPFVLPPPSSLRWLRSRYRPANAIPAALLMAEYTGWLLLALLTGLAIALGIGSLLSGRLAIGVVLAWQFVVTPLLLQTGIDSLLVGAALQSIEPGTTKDSVSPAAAVLVLGAWTLIPLVAGARRTVKRDA